MANDINYAVTTEKQATATGNNKFTISRILDNSLNNLLSAMVPAEVPEKFTVEITLYSLYNNQAVFHTIYGSDEQTDVFSLTTLNYQNGGYRRLLFIDFSRIPLPFSSLFGRHQIVLNFFETEIENELTIKKISPDRTEIELELLPGSATSDNLNLVKNFAYPQITSTWVYDAIRQMCNQPSSSTSDNIPTDRTNLTYEIIKEYLPANIQTILDSEDTSEEFKEIVQTQTQKLLNSTYGLVTQSLLASSSVIRFIEPDLNKTILSNVSQSFSQYQQIPEFIFI